MIRYRRNPVKDYLARGYQNDFRANFFTKWHNLCM